MRTKISKRGQVSVPSKIRKALSMGPDTTVEWVLEGGAAKLIPIPDNPIKAFRGSGKRGLVSELLKDRRKDRQKEDAR
jgi:bifunctional DNA-binding transcriptional regulator/antitoxin component of YhaV-PrlF toxin-antitoxin module